MTEVEPFVNLENHFVDVDKRFCDNMLRFRCSQPNTEALLPSTLAIRLFFVPRWHWLVAWALLPSQE